LNASFAIATLKSKTTFLNYAFKSVNIFGYDFWFLPLRDGSSLDNLWAVRLRRNLCISLKQAIA